MWRLVLIVTLLRCSSEPSVTCRDENNGEVDWFIIYKAPTQAKKLTGLEYFYTDSARRSEYIDNSKAKKTKFINDAEGVLANTLRHLFIPVRKMRENFGFISYSDQPPGSQSHKEFGHSKGVVMVEKNNTGVWLLHSTPQFPFRRDQNKFWPKSGNLKAQTFICITFNYSQFEQIGTHLLDIRAFPFDHDVPLDFHDTLQQVVKWEQITPPPPPRANFKELTSRRGQKFYSIAKNVAAGVKAGTKRGRDEGKTLPKSGDGDLYVNIAHDKNVQGHLAVQTWGCQKERAKSFCGDKYNVYNIGSIATGMGSWKPTSDHSKWFVTTDGGKDWTCIADVNRSQSQFERRGGALCINNKHIAEKFRSFVASKEDCSVAVTHDAECEDVEFEDADN
ncbi:hypothetical protein Q5P01_003028 [Channa striata]|uniref:Deoxyribonuclease-2-alpha n=1 Tax=Channa striata TaxID=64152 RepID=A0AA88TEH7_CHASR|nr:hypothetical protein Q5P01_003028 [Channa striata]